VTTVRIAHAEPRPGNLGNGRVLIRGFLVVLADDAGHRALPLWLHGQPGGDSLWELLDPQRADTAAAEATEDLTARLLRAAGARVTGVDVDASAIEAPAGLLDPETVTTRIELTSVSAVRNAPSRLGLALALAAAAGAPVRVADDVMDRLAVPVEGDDLLTPFLDLEPPSDPRLEAKHQRTSGPGARRLPRVVRVIAARRPRFEPLNMAFADGLERWDLDRGFSGETGPSSHLTDYQVTAGDRSAILASAVSQPRGSATLVQTIFADDYRNATVTFSADVRADPATQEARLRAEILRPGWVVNPDASEDYGPTVPAGRDWARYQVTVPVPEDADMIRFGVLLTGPGVIELRNPDLGAPRTPTTTEP
jgi:hypothetical protein